jgi:hypothetical protein
MTWGINEIEFKPRQILANTVEEWLRSRRRSIASNRPLSGRAFQDALKPSLGAR